MQRLTPLSILIVCALSGCQSTPESAENLAPNTLAEQKVSENKEYQQANRKHHQWLTVLSESKHLKIYSPTRYSELLTSWNEAQQTYRVFATTPEKAKQRYSLFSSSNYAQKFGLQIDDVGQQYAHILKIKSQADELLSAAMTHMDYLMQHHAQKYCHDEYLQLQTDYAELFEYIEEQQFDLAQQQQISFVTQATLLEIKVILAKYVLPLQQQVEKAVNDGSSERAPISFALVDKEIDRATHILKANPRNSKMIEQAITEAQFELRHAQQISKTISTLAKDEEMLVLGFEKQLAGISHTLDGRDLRDHSLSDQVKLIVSGINNLHENNRTAHLEEKLNTLEGSLQQAAQDNQQQSLLLQESSDKNASLFKQLMRSEFQIEALQAELNTYKQSTITAEGTLQDEALSSRPAPEEVNSATAVVPTVPMDSALTQDPLATTASDMESTGAIAVPATPMDTAPSNTETSADIAVPVPMDTTDSDTDIAVPVMPMDAAPSNTKSTADIAVPVPMDTTPSDTESTADIAVPATSMDTTASDTIASEVTAAPATPLLETKKTPVISEETPTATTRDQAEPLTMTAVNPMAANPQPTSLPPSAPEITPQVTTAASASVAEVKEGLSEDNSPIKTQNAQPTREVVPEKDNSIEVIETEKTLQQSRQETPPAEVIETQVAPEKTLNVETVSPPPSVLAQKLPLPSEIQK